MVDVQNIGQSQQQQGQQANQSGSAEGQGGGSQQQSQTATRPDWLGESYWDSEKGAIKLDDFGKHYGEIFTAHKAQTDRLAAYPQKIEDMKFELPAELKLPEGFKLDESNKAFVTARQLVFENKIDPSVASKLIALHVQQQMDDVTAINTRIDEETGKLGANAAARVGAVTSALEGKIGKDAAGALASGIFTAAQVEAFEKIVVALANGGSAAAGGGQREAGNGVISDEEYERMTPAERLDYARKHQQQRKAA